MSITGKFKLERNEQFYEHLIALGVQEEKASMADRLKPVLEISIDGNKLTFISYSGEYNHKTVLILNEEIEEKIAIELHINSIARKIDDHTIEIESTGFDASSRGRRRYDFSEQGMVMTIENDDKSLPIAKRYYSRLQE